ncbi:MAG: YcxB family protein [Pseudomonadota bacterium]
MAQHAETPAPSAAITARYQLSYADYLATADAHVLRKPRWRRPRWIHWVLTAVIFLMGLFLQVAGSVFGALLIGGAIVVLALEFVIIPYVRRRAYAKHQVDGADVAIALGQDGLRVAHAAISSHVEWSGITGLDRFRDGVVIWFRMRHPFYVPDRAFEDPGDAARFRAYVEENATVAPAENP